MSLWIVEDPALAARIQEKKDSRKEDLRRLAAGEVTPEQLQEENSMFPEGWARKVGCSNLYENVGIWHDNS